jgi:hypothetical protein
MRIREHIEANEWSGARTVFEDEFGNRGEVRWPRVHNYGLQGYVRWYDAEVHINTHAKGSADEIGAYAEFALHLAHVGKTLDLAFAKDKEEALGAAERFEEERIKREAIKSRALQMRCEELAQYYMQMVRVQRDGYSSNASGELHVVVLREGEDDQAIKRQMWLKERNGNRRTFNADGVAKFEVKDGSRYNVVKLTPMETLRAQASVDLLEEAV